MPAIDGLASGLDTTSIVKNLMAVERLPQGRMSKAKVNAEAMQGALSRLNGLVKTLADAAKGIDGKQTVPNPWTGSTASISNKDIASVTATSGAIAGAVSFKVINTAKAIQDSTQTSIGVNDKVFDGLTLQIGTSGASVLGPKPLALEASDTIADVAKKINDLNAGVKASLVRTSTEGMPAEYKMVLTADQTGSDTAITFSATRSAAIPAPTTGPDALAIFNNMTTIQEGVDAEIQVQGGDPITSHTNTFKDLMPGLSVTVNKADPAPVTATVARDVGGIADKMDAMVKAANEVLSNIRINSKYDPEKKLAGQFTGDATTRDAMQRIVSVFAGANGALVPGVSMDKTGAITFDRSKFADAYAKDPAKVELSASALGKSLYDAGQAISNPTNGIITARIQGEQTIAKDYGKRMVAFEEKMTQREAALFAKFQRLEKMLNKLKGQGNWLAGQLGSLPVNQKTK